MSHQFLFYSGPVSGNPEVISLTGEEHHHLSRVLRMRIGEETWVTDGEGKIYSCIVEKINKDETALRVTSVVDRRPLMGEMVLGLACIKKDRFERALAMCTEIGVTRFVPVVYDNSILRGFPDSALLRFRRTALEAMKQSFRAVLPRVEGVEDFDSFIEKRERSCRIIAGERSGGTLASIGDGDVIIMVGPEAGFSEREAAILKDAGCSFTSVSPNRLRSETAAVSLCALVSVLRASL